MNDNAYPNSIKTPEPDQIITLTDYEGRSVNIGLLIERDRVLLSVRNEQGREKACVFVEIYDGKIQSRCYPVHEDYANQEGIPVVLEFLPEAAP